jgi:hypothetical protein
VIKNQGISILLNIFFGPLINAAQGIAFQIGNAIKTLSNNSYTSIRPRITKLYAEKNNKEMFYLFFIGTRIIYYLMIFFTIPVFLEVPFILSIWLKNIPDHTVIFVRLVLIDLLIESLRYPLQTIVFATGNVRNYQLMVSGISLLFLPISYMFLKVGFPPQVVMIIAVFISIIAHFIRLYNVKKIMKFPMKKYCIDILIKFFVLSILMVLPSLLIRSILSDGIFRFFIVCGTSVVSCSMVIYLLGLQKNEQNKIKTMIMILFMRIGLLFG